MALLLGGNSPLTINGGRFVFTIQSKSKIGIVDVGLGKDTLFMVAGAGVAASAGGLGKDTLFISVMVEVGLVIVSVKDAGLSMKLSSLSNHLP